MRRSIRTAYLICLMIHLLFAGHTAILAQDNPFSAAAEKIEATPEQANPFAPKSSDSTDLSNIAIAPGVDPAMDAIIGGGARASALGNDVKAVYVSATRTGFRSGKEIDDLLEAVTEAGFNRIYFETRTVYGISYDSEMETPFGFITPDFPNPIGAIKRRLPSTIEVYAVVTILPVYNAALGSRPPPANPAGQHPEFAMRNIRGESVTPDSRIYFDPGSPAAVAYLSRLLAEIDRKIQPDGYLLDGLKYPGKDWGYNEDAVNAFRQDVGGTLNPKPDNAVWSAWRRDALTRLLGDLRSALGPGRDDVRIAAMIDTEGLPPLNGEEWLASETYSERMQDWIGWGRTGAIDEIVLEVHERVAASGNRVADWVDFLNNNKGSASGAISLVGGENNAQGLIRQYSQVRGRGLGTILYSYDNPLRSISRGFFASLPVTVFKAPPGRAVPGRSIQFENESRSFTRMPNPPEGVALALSTPTPTPAANRKPLIFTTPSAIPTASPEVPIKPERIERIVTLTSGMAVNAFILEATSVSIKLEPIGGEPVIFARSTIDSIDPPIE